MNHKVSANFARNIGLVILLNLLIKPTGLFLEMFVQNRVGNELWGVFASLFSFAFIFSVLSDLGINQFLTKSVAESPALLKRLFPQLFWTKVLLIIIYPFVLVFLGFLTGFKVQYLFYLALLSSSHAILQMNNFLRGNFQGFQLFKLDAFAANFDKVMIITLTIGLLWLNTDADIVFDRYFFLRWIAPFITFIILLVLTYHNGLWVGARVKWRSLRAVLPKAFPFAWMAILYSVNEKVDQVMVERLYSATEAGIYSAAYRWLDAFMMYLWVILPMFFSRFAYFNKDLVQQNKLLRSGNIITILPFMIAGIFIWWYGDLFFFVFSNSSPEELSKMNLNLKVLSAVLILHGFSAILSTFLTSTGYAKYVNKLLLTSISINIILNTIFIPGNGSLAASIATLASTIILAAGYIIFITKKKLVAIPFKDWLVLSVIGSIGALLTYFLHLYNVNWLIVLILLGTTIAGMTLSLKIIRIKDLKGL